MYRLCPSATTQGGGGGLVIHLSVHMHDMYFLNDSDGDNNGEKDERERSALHCEANGDN